MTVRITIEMELPDGLSREMRKLLPATKGGVFAQGRAVTEVMEVLRMRAEKNGGVFRVAQVLIK